MNRVSSFGLVVLICLFSGVLAAQAQNIDVQYPIGNSLNNGATVNYGKTGNGNTFVLNLRIANTGGADLALIAPTIQGSNFENVYINISGIPSPQNVAPAGALDFSIEVDPAKDSEWSFNVTIKSDDPVDGNFVLKFEGTEGKPDDDDDCSTSESSSPGFLILLAALSAIALASRLRFARE